MLSFVLLYLFILLSNVNYVHNMYYFLRRQYARRCNNDIDNKNIINYKLPVFLCQYMMTILYIFPIRILLLP